MEQSSATHPPITLRTFAEPPNLMSLVRIPLAALVWVVAHEPVPFLLLSAIAAITDLLDGLAARAVARQEGRVKVVRAGGVGDWLDPLCDKIFVASAIVAAYWFYAPPWYVLALVLFRDVAQVLLFFGVMPLLWHRRLRIDYRANKWGKATTVAQFLTLLAILLFPVVILPLAVLSFVLGVVTVVSYARRARDELRASKGRASGNGRQPG